MLLNFLCIWKTFKQIYFKFVNLYNLYRSCIRFLWLWNQWIFFNGIYRKQFLRNKSNILWKFQVLVLPIFWLKIYSIHCILFCIKLLTVIWILYWFFYGCVVIIKYISSTFNVSKCATWVCNVIVSCTIVHASLWVNFKV